MWRLLGAELCWDDGGGCRKVRLITSVNPTWEDLYDSLA